MEHLNILWFPDDGRVGELIIGASPIIRICKYASREETDLAARHRDVFRTGGEHAFRICHSLNILSSHMGESSADPCRNRLLRLLVNDLDGNRSSAFIIGNGHMVNDHGLHCGRSCSCSCRSTGYSFIAADVNGRNFVVIRRVWQQPGVLE